MYTFAKLSANQISALQQFEEREGLKLVALTDLALMPEKLDDTKIAAVKEFEQKLGACLVAVH